MGYRKINKDRMEKIYRSYKDDVYKACLHYMKNEDLALELAQQVFFNFYQHIDQAEIECAQAYLIRSARNVCIDYKRAHKHEVLHTSWDDMTLEGATVISVEEAYFRDEEKKQKAILSGSILERLREENENWYTAIDLAYCLGKPFDVVADEMGISIEALYSLTYRAKKWIRKNYACELEKIIQES